MVRFVLFPSPLSKPSNLPSSVGRAYPPRRHDRRLGATAVAFGSEVFGKCDKAIFTFLSNTLNFLSIE